jgi:quercetin dioxygenase-like cupin family protein
MLHPDTNGVFDTQVYDVVFEPSALTYWHSHSEGQILLVADGVGYYQEKGKPAQLLKPGDVVPIPPDCQQSFKIEPFSVVKSEPI